MRDLQVVATKQCFSLLSAGILQWQLECDGAEVVHIEGRDIGQDNKNAASV